MKNPGSGSNELLDSFISKIWHKSIELLFFFLKEYWKRQVDPKNSRRAAEAQRKRGGHGRLGRERQTPANPRESARMKKFSALHEYGAVGKELTTDGSDGHG